MSPANHRAQDYNHPVIYGPDDQIGFLAQRQGLLNSTKFAASLLERSVCLIELSEKAFSVIWQAVEQNYDDETFGETVLQLERQILIPAAATWLLIAGKTIYDQFAKEDIAQSDANVQARESSAELPWSKRQWSRWKIRFQELASDQAQALDDECREFASRAAGKMTEVEAGYQG